MPEDLQVIRAGSTEQMSCVRALFVEYQRWLNVDLCFQSFEDELGSLPGKYAPPRGCLLLGKVGDAVVGGVGLRPLVDDICEMKRLFVRPRWRGRGYGRRFTEEIVEAARAAGYARMRLDTLGRLKAAFELYRSMGFFEIQTYRRNPQPDVVYMERDL